MAYSKEKRFRLMLDAKAHYEAHREIAKTCPADVVMVNAWRDEYAKRFRQVYGVELAKG